MLATTLWLLVALGLLATALLDAGAAFARAGIHAAAGHAVESAMHDALADYENQLGAAIARGGTGPDRYATAIAAVPNPLARAYAAATDTAAPASFSLASTVVPTTVTAPACDPSGVPAFSGPDTIAWLQCNGVVAESRLSVRLTVRVVDASGATLAQRDRFVTLRLFGEPPYSAVVGSKDADASDPGAADVLAAPAHEGDVGGDTVSGGSQPAASTAWPAGGTLIHVRFECRDGSGSCANAAPPDPDAALEPGARWQNGNRPAP